MVYLSRLLLSFLSVDGGSSPFLGSPRGLRGRRSRQERPGVRPVADYEAYFAVFFPPRSQGVSSKGDFAAKFSLVTLFRGRGRAGEAPRAPPGERKGLSVFLISGRKKETRVSFLSVFRDLGEYFPEEEFPSFLFCFVFFSGIFWFWGFWGRECRRIGLEFPSFPALPREVFFSQLISSVKREGGPPGGASGGGQVTGRGSSGARRPEVQVRGPFRTRGLGLDGFPRTGFPRRLGKALVVTDVFVSLPSVFVTGVKIASVFGFCRTGCGVCCGCLFSSHSLTFFFFSFLCNCVFLEVGSCVPGERLLILTAIMHRNWLVNLGKSWRVN